MRAVGAEALLPLVQALAAMQESNNSPYKLHRNCLFLPSQDRSDDVQAVGAEALLPLVQALAAMQESNNSQYKLHRNCLF